MPCGSLECECETSDAGLPCPFRFYNPKGWQESSRRSDASETSGQRRKNDRTPEGCKILNYNMRSLVRFLGLSVVIAS